MASGVRGVGGRPGRDLLGVTANAEGERRAAVTALPTLRNSRRSCLRAEVGFISLISATPVSHTPDGSIFGRATHKPACHFGCESRLRMKKVRLVHLRTGRAGTWRRQGL